jgi:hypothetical protein
MAKYCVACSGPMVDRSEVFCQKCQNSPLNQPFSRQRAEKISLIVKRIITQEAKRRLAVAQLQDDLREIEKGSHTDKEYYVIRSLCYPYGAHGDENHRMVTKKSLAYLNARLPRDLRIDPPVETKIELPG